MSKKRGALLLNLGSPDSTDKSDVRRYLKEFLSDPRVIDGSPLKRWFVVNCCILPFRPKETAHAYKKIWGEQGSPLIETSKALQRHVAEACNMIVELGMRYGNPSIHDAVRRLKENDVQEVMIVPLYPHYAMSSYETVLVKTTEEIRRQAPQMKTRLLQPFYNDQQYIEALFKVAEQALNKPYDYLLFSFHGIPERHLRTTDPSHAHCLCTKDCCYKTHPSHATCYKHQCYDTMRHFTKRAGIHEGQYGLSFQSRLGRDPWLEPYTDAVLEDLPKKGIKKLLVVCPSFVTDCLETLEEIEMRARETFMQSGGEYFYQIPCLNEHPEWIGFLKEKLLAWS